MKARYYVELFGLPGKWLPYCEFYSHAKAQREAVETANWKCDLKNCSGDPLFPHKAGGYLHGYGVRIRYRGRVIARWKNGKRVKKESK